MNKKQVLNIFHETAYVRMGGSAEEKQCAGYLQKQAEAFGAATMIEEFEVDMATIQSAELIADGVRIPCKGYLCSGSGEVEAPFYYLTNTDAYSLSLCKGKIVMIDGYLGNWIYHDILDNGAVGFITYDGNANYGDFDIDQRELRSYISKGKKIVGVNINAKSAIKLIEKHTKTAKIVLKQDEYKGTSQNVIAEIKGELDEWIVFTAHYDTTSLSQGAYDNMSGCIGLLGIMEHFAQHSPRYSLRFIFCGSEERGLLGSKAYVAAHEKELEKIVLNVNLDMIGSTMGHFIAACTSEQRLVDYISYFSAEQGFGISAKQDVYSSDSTPFADKGVPAVSFARCAPPNTATIHNSYDTLAVMSPGQMLLDIAFILEFTKRMACAARCPVARKMPDNMKEKLDVYLLRKRKKD